MLHSHVRRLCIPCRCCNRGVCGRLEKQLRRQTPMAGSQSFHMLFFLTLSVMLRSTGIGGAAVSYCIPRGHHVGSEVDLISCGCGLDKHSMGPKQGHHMENVLQPAISLCASKSPLFFPLDLLFSNLPASSKCPSFHLLFGLRAAAVAADR